MSGRIKTDIIYCFAVFVIIFLCCANFSKLRYVGVMNDEFGYWANAASIVGYDWHDLIVETPYYAIGYSICLVPIVKFLSTAEFWYKAAIMLNVILLLATYFLCCSTGKKLYPQINKPIMYLASLIVIIYPGNIAYSQVAWSETLQYFLVWCITYNIVCLEKQFSYKNIAAILLLIVCSLSVHFKNINLLAVGLACLFMILIKNRKPWYIILGCLLALVAGCGLINCIKNYQISLYWDNSAAAEINNVTINGGTLAGYLNSLFSNFKDFLSSLGSKLFYLIFGTGFLFPVAFGSFVISVVHRKNLFKDECISKFWCISIAVVAWGLCSFQMMGWQGRKDLAVYSRYMEQAIGPVLLVGIVELLTNFREARKYVMLSSIAFMGMFLNIYKMVGSAQMNFNSICSPVIGAYIDNTDNIKMAFQWIFFVAGLLIALLIGLTYMKKGQLRQVIILLVFGVLFTITGMKATSATGDYREEFVLNNMIPIKEGINDYADRNIVYIKDVQDDQYSVNPKFVQFMFPKKSIHIVEIDDLDKIDEATLVLINPKDSATISSVESMENTINIANTEILKLYQIGKD